MTSLNFCPWWAPALAGLALCTPALSRPGVAPHHHAPASAPAHLLTGSYDGPHDCVLDVLEIPGGKIKFDLIALSERLVRGAPNTGEASGVLPLRGGVAVYRFHDEESGAEGTLRMRFQKGRVFVSQQGEVGFDRFVNAGGTYVRHSRKAPVFGKESRSM